MKTAIPACTVGYVLYGDPGDQKVLLRVFKGERLEGWLLYSADMKRVISHDLRPVAAIE